MEWDYNEVLSALAKAAGVELDDDDYEDEDENTMHCVGVKSAEIYFGGTKLPSNPATQIYCDGPIGNININFNHD